MIRNHLVDPESPEKRANIKIKAASSEFEDPWYAASSQENSPTSSSNTNTMTPSFG